MDTLTPELQTLAESFLPNVEGCDCAIIATRVVDNHLFIKFETFWRSPGKPTISDDIVVVKADITTRGQVAIGYANLFPV